MPVTTEKENDFVSQSDIDQLLAEAEETASADPDDQHVPESAIHGGEDDAIEEDIPADNDLVDDNPVADDPVEGTPADSAELTDEFDQLFEGTTDAEQSDSEEIPDRVILEEVSEKQDEKPQKEKTTWIPQKQFWVAISIVCGLGVAANGFFWTQNRIPADFGKPAVLSFPVVQPVDVSTEAHFLSTPSSISLKGFIIPAPLNRKDITYVAADISIELTTDKALSLVKDHAPFYRNIIYDVIHDALKALDKSKISEISLKISILKALNSAVPERSVKDVIVDTFVMF